MPGREQGYRFFSYGGVCLFADCFMTRVWNPKELKCQELYFGRTLPKGYRLCVEVCPAHILKPSGRFSRHGYEVMEMEGQCTGCTSCAVMCPDVAIRVFKARKPGDKA